MKSRVSENLASYSLPSPPKMSSSFDSTATVASVNQSCPNLCSPMDCSPPGFSVHGILQARLLEWVTMPSSSCHALLQSGGTFFLSIDDLGPDWGPGHPFACYPERSFRKRRGALVQLPFLFSLAPAALGSNIQRRASLPLLPH